jgi:hypothetical protein
MQIKDLNDDRLSPLSNFQNMQIRAAITENASFLNNMENIRVEVRIRCLYPCLEGLRFYWIYFWCDPIFKKANYAN